MKKVTFAIMLLTSTVVSSSTSAQVLGLYAKSITETELVKQGTKEITTKNPGPFYLIYTREYCKIYFPPTGWVSFPAVRFTSQVMGDGTIMESFISDETDVSPFGMYDVMIFKGKDGYNFEVVLKNGHTLMGEHAELYSENGRVPNAPYIANWKELQTQFAKQDSLAKIKQQEGKKAAIEKKREDSIAIAGRDSLNNVNRIAKLNQGNNYQQMNIRWLADTLAGRIRSTIYFYSDFKIHMDRDGIITKAEPVKPMAPNAEPLIAQINQELIGRKLKAYVSADGNTYPSYTNLYITLLPKR